MKFVSIIKFAVVSMLSVGYVCAAENTGSTHEHGKQHGQHSGRHNHGQGGHNHGAGSGHNHGQTEEVGGSLQPTVTPSAPIMKQKNPGEE